VIFLAEFTAGEITVLEPAHMKVGRKSNIEQRLEH